MNRYVALLRAINVGGHRVAMSRLRSLFEELDLVGVSTFIASGNVIFSTPERDAAALEVRIERHLAAALGYAVDTFLRTPAELAEVAARRPFADADLDAPGHTIHVAFLREPPSQTAARALLGCRTERDEFQVAGREFHWLVRGKTTESLVTWPRVAAAIRVSSTMRNLTTVRRLAANLASS
jgi:uncharacterized protein (DUF1697 family)